MVNLEILLLFLNFINQVGKPIFDLTDNACLRQIIPISLAFFMLLLDFLQPFIVFIKNLVIELNSSELELNKVAAHFLLLFVTYCLRIHLF
jgi:hypothetical protein